MGFRSIGEISRGLVARARRGERVGAVDKVATLACRGEIKGRRDQIAQSGRAPEPGEIAALAAREREVGR